MGRKPRWLDETHDASGAVEGVESKGPTLRVTPAEPMPLATELPDEIPQAEVRRYAILGEVAQGGVGRILAAEDRTLKRKVAIKELLENRGYARFLREAMVTARLQHPSIVPLYDVGRWPTGEPYYSMRLVSGRPLDQVIASTKSLDDRLALLPHVIAVADAIAYAHSEQIIHRDLKPANVLVGEFGETVVIDWGLAKDLGKPEQDADDGPYRVPEVPLPLTQAGAVLGTPVYMAPEQAMGKELDQRADVYAIGAILYELLTGHWPHHGSTTEQVIARLSAGEPLTPIQMREPDAPRDLAAIVDKAMKHDPAARYPSAAELAADLRRFQTGQLVAAHHYSRPTLMRRWLRRHRAAVAASSVLVVALAITATLSVRSILAERNATRAERDRLILANAAGVLERDPTAAVAWLKTYPATGAEPMRVRGLALDARARGVATHVLPRDLATTAGRFSPDGRRFAQPHPTGLRVIDLATGKRLGPTRRANALQWSPDGKRLVVATWAAPHETVIVDLATGAETPIRGEIGPWSGELFAPDGTLIVPTPDNKLRHVGAGTEAPVWTPFPIAGYARRGDRFVSATNGALTWWDARERVAHPLATPAGISIVGSTSTYALLGDGTAVAAGTSDGRLCVWSLPDGSARVLDGDTSAIAMLAVSRDGTQAVTLAEDSSLRSWALASGQSRALPKLGEITDLDLAADGRAIVVGLDDHRILVLDPRTGDQHQIGMHAGEVRHVMFSPDARWVASGSDDGTTRLWQLRADPFDQLPKAFGRVSSIARSAGDRTIVLGGDRPSALLVRGDHRIPLPGHVGTVMAAALSADGSRIATGADKIHVWDGTTGAAGPVLDAKAGRIVSLAMTRDGARIVSSHVMGDIRVWEVATGQSRVLANPGAPSMPALAPDGRTVAIGERDGGLALVALDGTARTLAGAPGAVDILKFSPSGRHVAGCSSSAGHVRVWDLTTGKHRELARKDAVAALAFSGDGRWLAVAGAHDVGLVDLATGAERTLAQAGVWEVAFVAAGVVTGGEDGAVRVWGFDGIERSRLRVDGAVMRLEAGDHYLLAGTSAGEVYRWPLAALGEPAGTSLATFLDSLTHATRLD